MAKIRPYIIHDHLTVQEIQYMICQAYDEGFENGKKKGYEEGFAEGSKIALSHGQIITTRNYPITTPPSTTPLTPNDYPPTVIYCENSNVAKTGGDTP